jgi:D-galactarolactone cycloisomerase
MKINCIDLYFVKIPLEKNKPSFFKQPAYFNPSWIPGFRQSEVRFYFLKLKTDSGIEGYSAITAMGLERVGLGSIMGNYLMGINPLDLQLVNQRIQEFSYIGMRNSWIEAAFWDIIGKVKGDPLWKILGGTGGYVEPYISTGSNHNHDPKIAGEISKRVLDSGYKGIKLRVKSGELAPMIDYIGGAHEAAGKNLRLMVDANQGWPVDLIDETPKWNLKFATEFAQSIEIFDIKWLEEPLNRGNFEGLANLRKNTKTPIAGGELNSSWRDFKTMLDIGSLDIYQPDAIMAGGTYAGGISVVYWLIREIQKRNKKNVNVKFCPHTWTTGLGFAVALQLIGIIPQKERSLIEYPLEGNWKTEYWARFLKNNFEPNEQGQIKIPDDPGLGIEIDWNVIRRFGKRIYHGTSTSVSISALRDRGLKQAMYLRDKKKEQSERTQKAIFKILEAPF